MHTSLYAVLVWRVAGTHVAGTLVGLPYSAGSLTAPGTQYIGVAPGARLAFFDMGSGSDSTLYAPPDLAAEYFPYTTAVVSASTFRGI